MRITFYRARLNLVRALSGFMGLCLLAACSANPTGGDPAAKASGSGNGNKAAAGPSGTAQISLKVGKVGALSKSATISMRKLILTVVAGTDTVRDTSALSGNETVTVKRALKLKAKTWVLYAKTLDQKDSVIHSGASNAFTIKLSENTEVNLPLQSRFTMYQATYSNMPFSIGYGDSKNEKLPVAVTRLIIKVDEKAVRDTTAKEYFPPDKSVFLDFDYVTVGKHDIVLQAHCIAGTYSGLCYEGSSHVTTVAGEDESKQIVLHWVGPSVGSGNATIIVGRVGKLEIKPHFVDSF